MTGITTKRSFSFSHKKQKAPAVPATPRFEPLLPSHQMLTPETGYTLTAHEQDGTSRNVGMINQNIGSRQKNEDYATVILVKGDKFLDDPESSKAFFQSTMNAMHDKAFELNTSTTDDQNQGGSTIIMARITRDTIECSNAGDSPAGVVHNPPWWNINKQIIDRAFHHGKKTFSELTARHCLSYDAGQKDWENTYHEEKYSKTDPNAESPTDPAFNKDRGPVNNATGLGVEPTRGIGDNGSRYEGLPQRVQENIKATALKLFLGGEKTTRGDVFCAFSDGVEVNPRVPLSAPRIPLKAVLDAVKTMTPSGLSTAIDKANKTSGITGLDNQTLLTIDPRTLKQGESLYILLGDGHAHARSGCQEIIKQASEIFTQRLQSEFENKFPDGTVMPAPVLPPAPASTSSAPQS